MLAETSVGLSWAWTAPARGSSACCAIAAAFALKRARLHPELSSYALLKRVDGQISWESLIEIDLIH